MEFYTSIRFGREKIGPGRRRISWLGIYGYGLEIAHQNIVSRRDRHRKHWWNGRQQSESDRRPKKKKISRKSGTTSY